MGTCRFCGESAGLFHHEHPECRQLHDAFVPTFGQQLLGYLRDGGDPTKLATDWKELSGTSYVTPSEFSACATGALKAALKQFETDGLPSEPDLDRLTKLRDALSIPADVIAPFNAAVFKDRILIDLQQGRRPDYPKPASANSLMMADGESFLYEIIDSTHYQYGTAVSYEGSHDGYSVRVSKGLYYHAGTSESTRIEVDQLKQKGIGKLFITTMNVTFVSDTSGFRSPLSKLILVDPTANILRLMKDGTTQKPHLFSAPDPTFLANLILSARNFKSLFRTYRSSQADF